jgi:hypothetical protein
VLKHDTIFIAFIACRFSAVQPVHSAVQPVHSAEDYSRQKGRQPHAKARLKASNARKLTKVFQNVPIAFSSSHCDVFLRLANRFVSAVLDDDLKTIATQGPTSSE